MGSHAPRPTVISTRHNEEWQRASAALHEHEREQLGIDRAAHWELVLAKLYEHADERALADLLNGRLSLRVELELRSVLTAGEIGLLRGMLTGDRPEASSLIYALTVRSGGRFPRKLKIDVAPLADLITARLGLLSFEMSDAAFDAIVDRDSGRLSIVAGDLLTDAEWSWLESVLTDAGIDIEEFAGRLLSPERLNPALGPNWQADRNLI